MRAEGEAGGEESLYVWNLLSILLTGGTFHGLLTFYAYKTLLVVSKIGETLESFSNISSLGFIQTLL